MRFEPKHEKFAIPPPLPLPPIVPLNVDFGFLGLGENTMTGSLISLALFRFGWLLVLLSGLHGGRKTC